MPGRPGGETSETGADGTQIVDEPSHLRGARGFVRRSEDRWRMDGRRDRREPGHRHDLARDPCSQRFTTGHAPRVHGVCHRTGRNVRSRWSERFMTCLSWTVWAVRGSG